DCPVLVIIKRLGIHSHSDPNTQLGFTNAQVIGITALNFQVVLRPQVVVHDVPSEATSQLKYRCRETDHLSGWCTSVTKAGLITQPLTPVKGGKTRNPIHTGKSRCEIQVVKHVLGELRILLSKNLIRRAQ